MHTINFSNPIVNKHDISVKNKAIELRRNGLSYKEILNEIKVSKSTLSLWLRNVGLSKRQIQRITKKKIQSARRGGIAKRIQSLERKNEIYSQSSSDISNLSDRDIWLIATALYWAEGSKEKLHKPGSSVEFANTDPRMLRIFLYWLTHLNNIILDQISFEIYIHTSHVNSIDNVKKYWSEQLKITPEKLNKVRYKTHKISTNRKNTGILYNGLIRVKVSSSSILVRQFEGWVQGIDSVIEGKLCQSD